MFRKFLLCIIVLLALIVFPAFAPVHAQGDAPRNTGFVLQYRNLNQTAQADRILPSFRLTNTSADSVYLTNLVLTYWLTNEEYQIVRAKPTALRIQVGNGGMVEYDAREYVVVDVIRLTKPFDDATYRINFRFRGNLQLDTNESVVVDGRIEHPDRSYFNQANDFSYVAPGEFAAATKASAYWRDVNDQLIGGAEPTKPKPEAK